MGWDVNVHVNLQKQVMMMMIMMMMTRMKLVFPGTKFRPGIDKFYQPNSGWAQFQKRGRGYMYMYMYMCALFIYCNIYIYMCIAINHGFWPCTDSVELHHPNKAKRIRGWLLYGCCFLLYMKLSINVGFPKWMVYNGKSYLNG